MRTFLALLLAVVILGGGWYFYSQQQAAIPEMNTEMDTDITVTPNVGTPPAATGTSDIGAVKEFTVTNTGMSFDQKTLTVKKGDTVKVTFKNTGGTHDWVVDEFPGARTKVIQAGQQETVTFVADKAGSFEYYCSVGEHRQMGMVGTLTVTE